MNLDFTKIGRLSDRVVDALIKKHGPAAWLRDLRITPKLRTEISYGMRPEVMRRTGANTPERVIRESLEDYGVSKPSFTSSRRGLEETVPDYMLADLRAAGTGRLPADSTILERIRQHRTMGYGPDF